MENKESTNHPGVSGKVKNKEAWVNPEKRADQQEFIKGSKEIGRSDNLFGREDLSEQDLVPEEGEESLNLKEEHILEALERSPEADVSRVEVSINGSEVKLSGEIDDIREEETLRKIVENVRGVSKVQTDLHVS